MTPTANSDHVVVIGAGIIGIACAHYLAAEGKRVTVLDKGTVAGACSQGNCGHVLPSHVLPLNEPGAVKMAVTSLFDKDATFRVKPQLRPSFANWMLQFAMRCTRSKMLENAAHLKSILDSSFQEFETLLDDGRMDCDWQKNGLLYLFQDEGALEAFSETDNLLSEHFNVSATQIDGEALPVFDPAVKTGLAGGYFYEQDAQVQPARLAAAWAANLKGQGVEFVEHCEALSVEKSNGEIKAVATTKGVFDADSIILAAGAYSSAFAKELNCSVPVLPGKGYALTFDRPERCPRSSVVIPERSVAITPFSDGLRFGSMMEFVGFDKTIPERRIQQLKKSAEPFLHDISADTPAQAWFGWRPMTWDSLPIIGRLPGLANAIVATGHCMMGVMLAPGTGRLVAEILGERKTHIPHTPFSPDRFKFSPV